VPIRWLIASVDAPAEDTAWRRLATAGSSGPATV
jgi:hypothetical protein